MRFITAIVFISSLFSQSDHCHLHPNLSSRSIYNIGDTLSIEDQNLLFPVCSGADGYNEGDFFSFSPPVFLMCLSSMPAVLSVSPLPFLIISAPPLQKSIIVEFSAKIKPPSSINCLSFFPD